MEVDVKKLNIAMFGQKHLSREGGIEVVVTELSTRMVKSGHRVTCYNRGSRYVGEEGFSGKYHNKYKGVRLKTVPTIKRKGFAAVSASFFAALACTFGRYDVVHIHAEGPAVMSWIPKLIGKRVIVTVHGLDHQREKWGRFARACIMAGERNAVRYADEIVVLSHSVQQYFMDTYGRRTVFIPNGVNRPKIVPANLIKEKFGLEKNSYLLFVARLVPEKGLQYLINAFKEIDTEKKLVIAGASSDSADYMQMIKNMAAEDSRIIFTGFVQGRTLDELYSNAYIYCLPSDLEGMPLSLLEAMSYGNCCLTSDIAECREAVENKAITFKKTDVRDLRDKLRYLIDHEEIVEKYKSQTANYICEKYNWDDVVSKTLELYESKTSERVRLH